MRSKMVRIYNSITRKKEEFVPLKEGQVSMYVCGPTVYNYIHIRNARPAIAFDTVRRYLEYKGYDVKYVSNFTEVDDKLIKAAQELNQTVPDVADRFIGGCFEDTGALNVIEPNVHKRVMDQMTKIVDSIKVINGRGNAYESTGDVYLQTRFVVGDRNLAD